MNWKGLLKTVATAGVTVLLAKGNKAKPRDFVNQLAGSLVLGRTDTMATMDLRRQILDGVRASGRTLDPEMKLAVDEFVESYRQRNQKPAAGMV